MAEEHQDKFSLPLAGVVALVAMAGAVVFYQTPLKTSRPIDQEAEKKAASHTRVQSRLWQDPFEAVETYRNKESERHETEKHRQNKSESLPPPIAPPSFEQLIKKIKEAGGSANFRIIPVFVDGSPYASGVESRLKDRYAVVSALGAAGYMPESGEYIRYFVWKQPETDSKTEHEIIIPVERFMPKAKIRVSKPEDVLVLWLKDQDFSENKPLQLMNELIGDLKDTIWRTNKFFRARDLEALDACANEFPGYKKWCGYQSGSIPNQHFHISGGLREVINLYWPTTVDDSVIFSCLVNESRNRFKFQIINNEQNKTSYTILGPRYSGTLSAMLKELSDYKAACGGGNNTGVSLHESRGDREDFKIYSHASTADENFIFDCLPDDEHQPKTSMQALFKNQDIGFIRTIDTEAVLAEQLVNELKRRQVDLTSGSVNEYPEKTKDPGNANEDSEKTSKDSGKAGKDPENANKDSRETDKECEPPIALISEWDTLYGRALPRTFAAVAENMKRNKGNFNKFEPNSDIDKLRQDDWPKRIVRYSYLAGLDGELPPKKDGTEADKTKDKTKDTDNKNRAVLRAMEEAAEGRDQLDYLQRMVMDLKQIEDSFNGDEDCNGKSFKLKLLEPRKSFKAIGVLGSDVYDKLLILQALKKAFPQAIFFTTNLDARLLHPDHREWTRNLIVASHFGLQLRPELQTPIPPFRDSAQTALFYSVFRALEYLYFVDAPTNPEHAGRELICPVSSLTTPEKEAYFSAEIKPRLYEIGRSGAIDISPDIQLPEEFESIHAARPDLDKEGVTPGAEPLVKVKTTPVKSPVKGETILWVSVALVFLGLGAMLISYEAEKLLKTSTFWIVMPVVILISIGLVIWAMSDRAEGEPFRLTQGVSVWPAVALQVLAMCLCFGFYIWARYILHSNDDKLSRQFDFSPPETRYSLEELLQRPWQWLSRLVGMVKLPKAVGYLADHWFSIPRWHETKDETRKSKKSASSRPNAGKTNISELWEEYRELRGSRDSACRIFPQCVLFCLFVALLYWKIGFPPPPCRRDACFDIYRGSLLISSLFLIVSMLYVTDAARLCRRFINILCEKKFPWPENAKMDNEHRYPPADREYLQRLLCVDLIGKWTAVVSKLLYFPFIILFLLVAARHPYIDNFDWPIWLAIIYGLIATYAVGVVVALRVTAEKAKKGAIEQLEEKLNAESSSRFSLSLGREERKRQIEEVIKRIKNNHEGAFLPFYKYPILGALAVPAGGTGLLYLIDYLVQSF